MKTIKILLTLSLITFFIFSSINFLSSQENKNKDEINLLKNQIQKLQKRIEKLEKEKNIPVEKGNKVFIEEDKSSFNIYWKNGLRIESNDKAFKIGVGGRIFVDFGFTNIDKAIEKNIGEMEDFAEARMARLYLLGTIYERFIFKLNFDFSGNVTFKDVYFGIKDLPLNGTLKIGFFKEPFGLEILTSGKFIPFMERSTTLTAFAPQRNLGIAYSLYDDNGKFTFSLGIFRESPDDPPKIQDDGSYAFTMRGTFLPYYEDKGEKLFHLGVAYSFRSPAYDTVRFRSRPEAHMAPRFVDTGNLTETDDMHLVGGEGALVFGPFSLQSEIVYARVRFNGGTGKEPLDLWGFYVQASFFVTGEHRAYDTKNGVFKRIKPKKDLFSKDGGFGAIELAFRFSHTILKDQWVDGRSIDDITFGVNWYLNPNMRIMLNYIYSNVWDILDYDKTDAHIFMTRFQLDL